MGIILEAEHLTYGYEEKRHAIEDLSIAFEEGKTTAILGANGAGKSTLFLHLKIFRTDHLPAGGSRKTLFFPYG